MAKFEIRIDPQKGKALYATETIYTGEVIFREEPLICSQFLWNAQYKYDSCDFCLTPLENAQENVQRLTGDSTIQLPYLADCCATNKSQHVKCGCDTRFCSAVCHYKAWQTYHRILCPTDPAKPPQLQLQLKENLEKLCDFWKSIHYPPETGSILLIVKIFASIRQSANPQELIQKYNEFSCKYSANADRLVSKLLGPQFQEQIQVLRNFISNIVYDESLSQFFTDNGFLSILAVIGQNGQGIGTSAFSKWAENVEKYVSGNSDECLRINLLIERLFHRMDELSGPFLNNEGSGLFRLQSIINHSCAPNAQVEFPSNNSSCAIKALENINAGEEILTSYLDECMRSRSRHSRIKFLQDNYLFTCHCRKCESQINDPDETSDDDDDSSVATDEEMYSD